MKINIELLITLIILFIPLLILIGFWQFAYAKWKMKAEYKFKKESEAMEVDDVDDELKQQAKVRPGNPILESLSGKYNIVLWGGLGCGKTLVANVIAKYIREKKDYYDYKNRRMLSYMNPHYLNDLENLADAQRLNIYSDIELEDNYTGFTNNELWPYLTQQKRIVESGILLADEIGTKFGKDTYWKQLAENNPLYNAAAETARYARQNTDTVFITTEQSCDNIWKPIRDKGFEPVQMLGVSKWLDKRGKWHCWWKKLLLNILPGWMTLNVSEVLACEFEQKNKLIAILKLLCPAYFFNPKQYYSKKIKIVKKISWKYTHFKANMNYQGKYCYLLFTNDDFYKYNTRSHKDSYNAQFDENGNKYGVTNNG